MLASNPELYRRLYQRMRDILTAQGLRVPAPAEAPVIAAFEAWTGHPLPPSFRLFCEMQDGWLKAFWDGIELPGLTAWTRDTHPAHLAWEQVRQDGSIGGRDPRELQPVGIDFDRREFLVFDTAKAGQDGEAPLLRVSSAEGTLAEWETVSAFLEAALRDSA